jgi:hypothetical protein
MRSLRLLLFITLITTFYSCQSSEPKKIAEKFLVNVTRGDLDEAKKYCDSTTKELLDQASYLNKIPDSVKTELRKLKINITDAKVNGDKAVVYYNTSNIKDNQMVSLIKQGEDWKVQLSKPEALQDNDEQPMLTEEPAVIDSTSNSAQ